MRSFSHLRSPNGFGKCRADDGIIIVKVLTVVILLVLQNVTQLVRLTKLCICFFFILLELMNVDFISIIALFTQNILLASNK